jgi:hypothetical protein
MTQDLGWQAWAVSKTGYWKVHPDVRAGHATTYTAFLGHPNSPLSAKYTVLPLSGKTPRAAVRKTLAQARKELAALAELIEAAEVKV